VRLHTRAWPDNGWLMILTGMTAAVTAAAFMLGGRAGVPVANIYLLYVSGTWLLALCFLLLTSIVALTILIARGERHPLTSIGTSCSKRINSHGEATSVLGPLLLLPLLMAGFNALKQLIPVYAPFSWDHAWAELERVICLGWTPWQVTHAVFGSNLGTVFLDRVYFAWLLLLFLVIPFFAFAAPPLLRARFFISFAASFVLIGLVGAYLFSSAGPCFAALTSSPSANNYVGLMARLHAIDSSGYHLSAVFSQEYLWQAHKRGVYGFGLGISAMPSMHNAIAFLYALASRQLRWQAQAGAWIFAALILIASVHLGWHYLPDGLVAWIFMYGIWRASGWYLRWSGYEQAVTPRPGPVLVTLEGQRLSIPLAA